MNDLQETRKKRFLFMRNLYEISQADPTEFVPESEIIEGTDIDKKQAQGIAQYLSKKGLLKYAANGPTFNITAYGIDEVERALSNPQSETQYFGQIVNILNINSVEGSQIQQGTSLSSQTMEIAQYATDKLTNLLETLNDKLDALQLGEEDKQVYLADLRTIETQMVSPKPKNDIIRSCLLSLKNIAENAAGSTAALGILKLISELAG